MSNWSDTITQEVLALREAGQSYGKIAATVGVSRSAIAGKIHRESGRAKPSKPRSPTPSMKTVAPVDQAVPRHPTGKRITVATKKALMCCFPLWHSGTNIPIGEKIYCAAPIEPGARNPYCPDHALVMYSKPPRP